MANLLSNVLDPSVLENKTYIMIIIIVFIIILMLAYISIQLNMKTAKCSKLSAQSNNKVKSISNQEKLIDMKKSLNEFFIKTAYNCCCIGNFKNDYVDTCALKNCASYGVRALDFQIYSLNNTPIVSASSVNSTQYKEIYNHISFYSAMKSVKQYFIDDSTNINRTDPLFLIFRLYSTNADIYDMMAKALNEVFGYASSSSNTIHISSTELDKTALSTLNNRVVIIVDPSYGNNTAFKNSKLYEFTSMIITGTNHIYREQQLMSSLSSNTGDSLSKNLTILYPNLQSNNNNFDFVTSGIFNNISFIGMNFQYYDQYLSEYNGTNFFSSCAFLDKTKTLESLCKDTLYNPGPKSIEQCIPFDKK